jgi:hypothetical protein
VEGDIGFPLLLSGQGRDRLYTCEYDSIVGCGLQSFDKWDL